MSQPQATYTPLQMKLVSRSRSREIIELGDWLDCHRHYIAMNGLFPEDRKEWLRRWGQYLKLVRKEEDFKEENRV